MLCQFPTSQRLNSELVDESKIVLAQIKFLEPIFGRKLLVEMASGRYGDYIKAYIAAPLALLVRYIIIEQLVADLGVMGVQQFTSDFSDSASTETIARLGNTLKSHAATLLGEAVEALDDYPELKELYQGGSNKVSIKAGFIL